MFILLNLGELWVCIFVVVGDISTESAADGDGHGVVVVAGFPVAVIGVKRIACLFRFV